MTQKCTLLRKNSLSVYLKDVAQTKTLSLLFPDYELIWEHPVIAETLLLLDTSANPLQFKSDLTWLEKIGQVLVLPGMSKSFQRILPCGIKEITL